MVGMLSISVAGVKAGGFLPLGGFGRDKATATILGLLGPYGSKRPDGSVRVVLPDVHFL